jgi:hypothetical protein
MVDALNNRANVILIDAGSGQYEVFIQDGQLDHATQGRDATIAILDEIDRDWRHYLDLL